MVERLIPVPLATSSIVMPYFSLSDFTLIPKLVFIPVTFHQELLQLMLGRQLALRKAKNIKYLAIVSPEEVTALTVTFAKIEPAADGTIKVQAQISKGETLYTKLSLTFA